MGSEGSPPDCICSDDDANGIAQVLLRATCAAAPVAVARLPAACVLRVPARMAFKCVPHRSLDLSHHVAAASEVVCPHCSGFRHSCKARTLPWLPPQGTFWPCPRPSVSSGSDAKSIVGRSGCHVPLVADAACGTGSYVCTRIGLMSPTSCTRFVHPCGAQCASLTPSHPSRNPRCPYSHIFPIIARRYLRARGARGGGVAVCRPVRPGLVLARGAEERGPGKRQREAAAGVPATVT